MGTTPGKLTIIGEMQESTGDTQTPEHWINVPVRDIIRETERGKHVKDSTGNPDIGTEPGEENEKTEKGANNAASNTNNRDKAGKQAHSNAKQSKTDGDTQPYGRGPESSADDISKPSADDTSNLPAADISNPSADDISNPPADNPVQGQSPQGEANGERSRQSENHLNDPSSPDPKWIEQAIASLDDADREKLRPSIEAFEAAVAAQGAAAENQQEAGNLSSYKDAVTQAIIALCKAAEDNGIALGAAVQDSGDWQGRGDNMQHEHEAAGSNHS
jgi:hypothetical protein